jgi:hypothetical protein
MRAMNPMVPSKAWHEAMAANWMATGQAAG